MRERSVVEKEGAAECTRGDRTHVPATHLIPTAPPETNRETHRRYWGRDA